MRILVVDDESTSRITLSGIAKKAGYVPTVVCDGKEAWERLQNESYPIVVTDWMMPEMNGIELTRNIRAARADGAPAIGYTYVLIVTALSARERTLEAFDAGADDLLVKPVDAEQVRARLTAAERIVREHAAATENAMRSAIGALQSVVGHDSPALLPSLSALVTLYRSSDSHAKARAFLRRQIEISARSLGDDHPQVVHLRNELQELGNVSHPPRVELTPPSR